MWGKRKADRIKKIRELGIRSKDDAWFENYEIVKEQLEKGVVLDTKHKRWLQRQKKADISDEKRDDRKNDEWKLISVKAGGLFLYYKIFDAFVIINRIM